MALPVSFRKHMSHGVFCPEKAACEFLSKFRSAKEARAILLKFKILVVVLGLNDKIVELSLNDDTFNDFEDGLQYYTALENEIEIIITRNLKDFKHSKIPAMTASQYLKK